MFEKTICKILLILSFQGVRESPEGGLHYSPEVREDITSYSDGKQQHHLSSSYHNSTNKDERQHRLLSTSVEVKEIAIQTDLDMVGMSKLIGLDDTTTTTTTGELFSPAPGPRSIPERLRKHNSIDMSSVGTVSCNSNINDIFINDDSMSTPSNCTSGTVVEESVINAVVDDSLCEQHNVDILGSAPPSIPPLIDSVKEKNAMDSGKDETPKDTENNENAMDCGKDEKSFVFEHSDNKYDASTTYTVDDKEVANFTELAGNDDVIGQTLDENNNENFSPTVDLSDDSVKKSPVNLFVANIVEYGRSDISSDSDTDKQSYRSRTRRKRLPQRRSRIENNYEKDDKDVDAANGSKESDTDLKSNKSDNEGSSKSSSLDLSGRRRRIGVSAEPVRVSWSTLRESFKQLQMSSTLNDLECEQQQEGQNGDTDVDGDAEIGIFLFSYKIPFFNSCGIKSYFIACFMPCLIVN